MGTVVFAYCERCTRRVKPGELQPEHDDYGHSKNVYVCKQCIDKANPGPMAKRMLRFDDPRPKGRPRPSVMPVPDSLGAWDPVGGLPPVQVQLGTYFGGV